MSIDALSQTDTLAGNPPEEFVAGQYFKKLLEGNDVPLLADVREAYRAVIIQDYYNSPNREISNTMVAQCAILGIDPHTGQNLEDPDAFIASYPTGGMSILHDQALVTVYALYKQNLHIRQSLATEAAQR